MSQAIERLNDMMNHQPAFRAFQRSTCLRVERRTVAGYLLLASLLTACAALPRQPTERALYIDARKALNGESRLGWTVDRVEVAEAANQAEPSACRVTPARRKAVRDWVNERIAGLGGAAKQQFQAGVDIDDLDEVIDLERAVALLDEVELHVPADCPFWIKPSDHFEGLHSTANRFILIADSMGGGSLSLIGRQVTAGGGGAARIFAGYGFSPHWQLAAGLEGGGDAILQKAKSKDGTEGGTLAAEGAFRFGVPAFLRLTDLDRIYDVEAALIARLKDGEFNPWGARVAVAGGVAGLRRLGFMPSLQLWFGYEIFPAQNGLQAEHVLRLGTRVGVDWDP
jgi:hypothetical protein